ncbi:MAG: hypothetical protein Q9223_005596, partial [Gallowayella weberi]
MVENLDDPVPVHQSRSSARLAHASHNLFDAGSQSPDALNESLSHHGQNVTAPPRPNVSPRNPHEDTIAFDPTPSYTFSEKAASSSPPSAPPPSENVYGEASAAISTESVKKPNIIIRFYGVCKAILLASWINMLLVFVPVGIAVDIAGINPTIIFAMNAIAIIPLAGLLSYATESVASEMGDTIGALMNVTFGNAVELIIFMYVKDRIVDKKELEACRTGASNSIALFLPTLRCPYLPLVAITIALVKNEIRIVQASLLGSILANLLLILGMGFLVGGLRYREQILLFVYVLYLLFQLKSHSYLYASTPQHVIDEESHPGVLADMLHSSSSSTSSSSSSSSDSDGSSKSHTTAKRIKRVLRGRRRRKSSASSKDTPSALSTLRTPSASTFSHTFENSESAVVEPRYGSSDTIPPQLGIIASGDEADTDGESQNTHHRHPDKTVKSRDFEKDKRTVVPEPSKVKERKAQRTRKSSRHRTFDPEKRAEIERLDAAEVQKDGPPNNAEQVFGRTGMTAEENSRRTFGKRGISNVLPALPTMPKMLSTTVFSAANPTGLPGGGPVAGVAGTNSLHRSTSLPSRLNRLDEVNSTAVEARTIPYVRPVTAIHPTFDEKDTAHAKKHLSRTSAIVLLLASTGLVAVCADFLVESINYLVDNTGVSEAFIGLIVLPIVGNAAEHVCAVTVAGKNKMDLAIGIAVGSSIQIAIFVTPVIVLLGWALQKDMSLYFSLFETVSLFVSAFIINFLILDGKSNYLEGALLIAAYVIIALAAFFYPDSTQQSPIGG